MLGSLYYGGQGVSRNLEYSATLFAAKLYGRIYARLRTDSEKVISSGKAFPRTSSRPGRFSKTPAIRVTGRGASMLASCTGRESQPRKMNPLPRRVSAGDATWAIGTRARRCSRYPRPNRAARPDDPGQEGPNCRPATISRITGGCPKRPATPMQQMAGRKDSRGLQQQENENHSTECTAECIAGATAPTDFT